MEWTCSRRRYVDASSFDPSYVGALTAQKVRRLIPLAATIVACVTMYYGSTRLARIVKINMTDSMPVGVYLVQTAPIGKQRIVVACPPPVAARLGLANGYLAKGSCASGAAPPSTHSMN